MKTFNEDTRVKIPGTIQFLRLGYNYQSLNDPNLKIDFKTKIFINRFKPALEKINNRSFTDEEIQKIISDINTLIEYDDLGKAFYTWLIKPGDERVKLIDFDNIENNDFAVVDELSFTVSDETKDGSFRPDINVLINGMPLAFLEVKPPNNEGGIQREFNRMIDDRLQEPKYKKYFNLIQIVSFSNNMEYEEDADPFDVKAGSFYTTLNGKETTFSFFREEEVGYYENYKFKDISDQEMKDVLKDCGYDPSVSDTVEFKTNTEVTTPCNRFITSLFDKERLMYILNYGFMFVNGAIPEKHIMRYPQFFATRNIIKRLESGDKRGIIWHTQGAGKTELAAYSNRIITDYYNNKNINTRFFYIVDRLYLLKQARLDFEARGFTSTPCNDRDDFRDVLAEGISDDVVDDDLGEFCVVNIHKINIDSSIPKAKNPYNVKVQRIFFVDEAHRSYKKSTGEFFKNLMLCDDDGAFIALTGTPLLSKNDRSTLRFGDYIDKYFYDKAIADGYTLKIKKEDIETLASAEIKKNLELDEKQIKDKSVYDSPQYIADAGRFIEEDYINFTKINNDSSVGGMIVCRGDPQAKGMYEWFKNNSSLSVGLVISDPKNKEQKFDNEKFQTDFRKPSDPEHPINLLIVNYMLTTGYDAHRLKKLYLLRAPRAHSLLQTISRVNRPYISSDGIKYRYGYLVDFADIDEEYHKTIADYTRELEGEYNGETGESYTLNGLLNGIEDIHNRYLECLEKLQTIISISNLEAFSNDLTKLERKDVYTVRKYIDTMRECETEFVLSKSPYLHEVDSYKLRKLDELVNKRIKFLNFNNNPTDYFNILTDDDVVEIVYEFRKKQVSILGLGDYLREDPASQAIANMLMQIREAILKNKNKDDSRVRNLNELLQEVFAHLSISSETSTEDIYGELSDILKEIDEINEENENLSLRFDGQYAFVKAYQDALDKYKYDEEDLEKIMDIIYAALSEILDKDVIYRLGRNNFIKHAKKNAASQLYDSGLYDKLGSHYDDLLDDIYRNLIIYGEDE